MTSSKTCKIALLLLSLTLSACGSKSIDCATAEQRPATPSLPSSARQAPLPSICSGDCLKSLTEWRASTLKRLAEVE